MFHPSPGTGGLHSGPVSMVRGFRARRTFRHSMGGGLFLARHRPGTDPAHRTILHALPAFWRGAVVALDGHAHPLPVAQARNFISSTGPLTWRRSVATIPAIVMTSTPAKTVVLFIDDEIQMRRSSVPAWKETITRSLKRPPARRELPPRLSPSPASSSLIWACRTWMAWTSCAGCANGARSR